MQVAVRSTSSAALALIERTMLATGQIAAEYPLVFGQGAPGRLVTLEENAEQVLSTCSILARELVTAHGIIRVGLIGSVSTAANSRGQGLASRVLERAEAELAQAGALLALLWADHSEFYEKRGWRCVGSETDWLIPLDLAHELKGEASVRPAEPADYPKLHALYERHQQRVLRTLQESCALYRVPEMEILVAERRGELCAYAAQGRGRDLQGVIHEWAGNVEDVLTLTALHLEHNANDLVLLAPSGASELGQRLSALGCSAAQGILGLGKVLRMDRIAALLPRYIGEAGRVREALGGLLLEGPRATMHLHERQVLELLCGLRCGRAHVQAIEGTTGLELPDLPLEPFLWGLDSI